MSLQKPLVYKKIWPSLPSKLLIITWQRLTTAYRHDIPLERRVEYLSRAIANGRSALDGRDREESERLREIQEKLEVARQS